jgi:hypothetical protein
MYITPQRHAAAIPGIKLSQLVYLFHHSITHMVMAVVVGPTTSHCRKIIYENDKKKSLEFDYH